MTIGTFTIRIIPPGDRRTLYIDLDTMEIDATPEISVSDIADAMREAGAVPSPHTRLDRMFGEEAA
jgi:hypothetical protein